VIAPPSVAPVAALSLTDIVRQSGQRNGLDPDLIHSVIAAESAGNPRAVSPKGAAGLMQLMPLTARALDVSDVFDPTQNVEAGTKYLRRLLDQYDHDLGKALAAYNAGPGKVDAYKGLPPYRETQQYVNRVIRSFNAKKLAAR
jgi:soluble lytic murein transglycosylase-like protein